MQEKFRLMHTGETAGKGMSFNPFGNGERKSKTIAIGFRKFLRNHISSTQYDEILKQFTKDMEVINSKIVPKNSYL